MLVATLDAKSDKAEAKRLLAQLELRLEVHVAERDKLRLELWELSQLWRDASSGRSYACERKMSGL
jgi:hypothetical protein